MTRAHGPDRGGGLVRTSFESDLLDWTPTVVHQTRSLFDADMPTAGIHTQLKPPAEGYGLALRNRDDFDARHFWVQARSSGDIVPVTRVPY